MKLLGIFVLFFSFAFCSNELIDDLYQRNDIVHINLLKNASFFQVTQTDPKLKVIENYYAGNYKGFIKEFNAKYSSAQEAEQQVAFFYLASKYRVKDYASLKNIIPKINPDLLSLNNWRDYHLISAVSKYWEGDLVGLNDVYSYLKFDSRSNKELLNLVFQLYQLESIGSGTSSIGGTPESEYYLGWNNLKSGKYDEAIAHLQKSISKNFVSAERQEYVDYGLGVANYAKGKKKTATQKFSLSYKDKGLKESSEFFKMLMLFDEQKYSAVITASVKFLKDYSAIGYKKQVSYLKGVSYYSLKQNKEAKKLLNELINFSSSVKYLLADVYFKEGSYKKANDYYKTVYNSKSGLKDYAGYGLAWSAFKLEEYQRAESLFEKLLKQKKLSTEHRFNIQIKSADSSYNLHKYKDAEKKYKSLLNQIAVRKDKYNLLYKQSIYNLSKVYIKLKKYSKANELLDQYLLEVKNDLETVIIKNIMASNYSKLKKYSDAAKIYEELLLIYPDHKDEGMYISLADSYFNAKEYGKAVVVYQDYLKEYKKGERDMDARYGLVQTLYRLGDFESAIEEAKAVDMTYGIGLLEEIEEKIKFQEGKAGE